MWIYEKIARAGLWNEKGESNSQIQEAISELQESELSKLMRLSLKGRKVMITGEFFPTTQEAFQEKLQMAQAKLMILLTSETELLICGKYPNWMLVEEAKKMGIKVIFIDKASDLFYDPTFGVSEKPARDPSFTYHVPLGI